jgi:hypothetical protein
MPLDPALAAETRAWFVKPRKERGSVLIRDHRVLLKQQGSAKDSVALREPRIRKELSAAPGKGQGPGLHGQHRPFRRGRRS